MTFAEDLRRLTAAIASAPMRPTIRIVSPVVYRKRAECPMWTNRANAAHVHDIDCSGVRETTP